jgi:hypothetical protein
MATVDVFPDAEIALLAVLAPAFPSDRVVTKVPADVTGTVIRVHRISGAARDIRIDRPIVDVDVFAADDGTASSTARNAQSILLSLAGTTVLNGVIQRVSVVNGPRWLPEDNPNLIRYGATYEMLIHAL